MAQGFLQPRDEFVFHVYVDPIFGDDYMATIKNPGDPSSADPLLSTPTSGIPASNPRLRPLDIHPDTTVPKPITGYLQQAPYAFRTINSLVGPGYGALWYVKKLFASLKPTPPSLPWTNPTTGKTVTHVVIHCLPGLYGMGLSGQLDIDPLTGLRYNNEQFPIVLAAPDRISLQGTSALDTILDGRRGAASVSAMSPLVVIGEDISSSTYTQLETFVDGFTFRGCRFTSFEFAYPCGAALFIGGSDRIVSASISNCVFTDNDIGIAISSGAGLDEQQVLHISWHEPRIVNNTFAWNRVGIWAGDLNPQIVPGGYTNNHAPLLINNIFDPKTPAEEVATGNVPGQWCFLGIHDSDREVVSRAGLPIQGVGSYGVDFNAWIPGLANGLVAYPNFPAITQPPLDTTNIPPIVNLGTYITRTPTTESTLFLNDVFRNSGIGRQSRHDFRLSPHVKKDGTPVGQGTLFQNPLVNSGIDGVGFSPTATINMRNAVTIPCRGPGLPAGVEDADLMGWDCDMEGFGNPRIAARNGFTAGTFGNIDLGADEMGDLIMGGYVTSTRLFTSKYLNQPYDHRKVYFFNLTNAGPFARPLTNGAMIDGEYYPGFAHVQDPDPVQELWIEPANAAFPVPLSTNYTLGRVISARWFGVMDSMPPPPNAQSPLRCAFMRNLYCDFSPHLPSDMHPYWEDTMIAALRWGGAAVLDPYSANPWYFSKPMLQTRGQADNPSLFNNIGLTPHNSGHSPYTVTGGLGNTSVISGHNNPPGTWPPGPWYIIPPLVQFGPFGGCGGGGTYQPGIWGFNDLPVSCPDILPAIVNYNHHGLRYDCQVWPS